MLQLVIRTVAARIGGAVEADHLRAEGVREMQRTGVGADDELRFLQDPRASLPPPLTKS